MNFFIWFGFLAVCFGITHGYGDCGRCDPNAHCEVDKCVCLEGFKGNGTTCVKETSECDTCSPEAKCIDNHCRCNNGYDGNGTVCRKACTKNTTCPGDARCVNGTCVKQDCQLNCTDNARCVNDKCQCNCGFKQDGDKCVDAETMCKHCPQLSSCENVEKDCRCKSGFVLDGSCCLRNQAVAGGNETSTLNGTLTNKNELAENTNDNVTGKTLQEGSNSIDNNTQDEQENNKTGANTDEPKPSLLTRTLVSTGGKNGINRYNESSSDNNDILGHTSKPQNNKNIFSDQLNDTVTNPKDNNSKSDTPFTTVLNQVNGVRTDASNFMQNNALHTTIYNMNEADKKYFQEGSTQEISSDSTLPRSATEKILRSGNKKKANKSGNQKKESKNGVEKNTSKSDEEVKNVFSPTTVPTTSKTPNTTIRPYVTKKKSATSSRVTYPTPKLPPFPPVSINLPSYTIHMHPSAYPTTIPGQNPHLPQLKVGPVEIVDENANSNNPEIPSMVPMNPAAVAVNTHVIDFKGAGGSEVVDGNKAHSPGQDPNLPQLQVGPVEVVNENANNNNPEIPSLLPMNPAAVAINTQVIDFKGAGGSEVVDRNEPHLSNGTVLADGSIHQLPSQTVHSAPELQMTTRTGDYGASPILVQPGSPAPQNPINPSVQNPVPMQSSYSISHPSVTQGNADLSAQPLVPAQMFNSPGQHPLMPQTINSAAHYVAPLQNPNPSPPTLAYSQNGYPSPQLPVSTQTAVYSPQYSAPRQNTNPSVQVPLPLPSDYPSSQIANSVVQQPRLSDKRPSLHKRLPKKNEVKKLKERHRLFSNPHPENPSETIVQSLHNSNIDRRMRVRLQSRRKSATG